VAQNDDEALGDLLEGIQTVSAAWRQLR